LFLFEIQYLLKGDEGGGVSWQYTKKERENVRFSGDVDAGEKG
jgi:hypothetical protein